MNHRNQLNMSVLDGVISIGSKRAVIYCCVSSPGQKENGHLKSTRRDPERGA